MDYALAKQLMDAGFPQGSAGKWLGPTDKIVWRNEDRAYAPTLEELIEACGEKLLGFDNNQSTKKEDELASEMWSDVTSVHWTARAFDRHAYASTPTEAVAKLWLALNTKGA